MLYVIGLGLSDEKDITVKGLEVRRIWLECRVFAESIRKAKEIHYP
jgi:diphthamide biosynthesis methyltransferase